MSVYVDMLIDYGWKLGPSCHLLADTENELHDFAIKKVGLKKTWFQSGELYSMPHYDLTKNKRLVAIKNGAIEIDRKQLHEMLETYNIL